MTQLKTVLSVNVINIICTGKIQQNRNSRIETKESLKLCYKYFMVQEDFCSETNGSKKLLFAYSSETSAALTYSNVLNQDELQNHLVTE